MSRQRSLVLASILFVVCGSYFYGFLSHRNHLFPYGVLTRVYRNFVPDDHSGLWGDAWSADDLAHKEALEAFTGLAYLTGYEPPPEKIGVIMHEPDRAQAGLNFYTSGHGPGAILMEMSGDIVHTWNRPFNPAWFEGESPGHGRTGYWRRGRLFENGDVLAIYDYLGMIKVDKDSNVLWKYMGGCHHDLELMPDGRIYTLTHEVSRNPRIRNGKPIIEDFIAVLSADGKLIRSFSLVDAFINSPYKTMMNWIPAGEDIFHTNTLRVLDGGLAKRSPAFAEGNLLISLRQENVIAVVDPRRERVVWAMSGMWRAQHDPKILENGNMLLFDNSGHYGLSKVIEFDPLAQKEESNLLIEFDPMKQSIAWSFDGSFANRFHTPTGGAAHRLPNGNTLIVQSDSGRVFEVTPGREVVWEFFNPQRAGENDELIAVIFDMERLRPDFPIDWAGRHLDEP